MGSAQSSDSRKLRLRFWTHPHPSRWTKTRVKYLYKYGMTTIGRNHQEQRMHHFHTTTTFFTDHSSLLLFDNVMAEITSGLERVRGTLLFYREISSHVKSKLEKSISHVYHVLPIITISAVVYNCTLTNIAYDRIYRIPDSPSNVLSFIPPHTCLLYTSPSPRD